MDRRGREVEVDYIAKIGKEFGSDLYMVRNDFIFLKREWKVYRSLFGTNPERVNLLNEVSGQFSWLLERTLFESVVLGLCRITDPPETGQGDKIKENMTIGRLRRHIEPREDCQKLKFAEFIKKIDNAAVFARDWRNRKIAHNDYFIRTGAKPLKDASREKIAKLVDAIETCLKWLHVEFLETELSFDVGQPDPDETDVLACLYRGLDAQKAERGQIERARKAGDYTSREAPLPDWLR